MLGHRREASGAAETLAIAISVGAGLFGALQPEINSELGDRVGSGLLAALVNFTAALVGALVMVALRPATRRNLAALRTWPVPSWTRAAGLGGVTVVLAGVVTVGRLGVAVFSVAFFAGQLTFGLVADRVGLSPGAPRAVTRARVASVVLALAAVVVAQLGRPWGEVSPGFVAFAVAAGAASAVQAAGNGRITAALRDPVAATVQNVVVGITALAVAVAVAAATGSIDTPHWPSEPWLYSGGFLGVAIVLALASATSSIGVLRTTVAMLAAQLIGAYAVDWVADGDEPTLGVVAAGALIVGAVAVVNRGRSPAAGTLPVTPPRP